MTDMHTTHLPPVPPRTTGNPRGNGTALNIVLAVIGGLVILTLLIGSARSAFGALSREHSTQNVSVEGVTELQISAGTGSFDLRFADINEATLEVESTSAQDWQLKRDGNSLVLDSPDPWGNWCLFGCDFQENTAVLTLPESMNDGTLDASFNLAAGDFNAVGSYKNLQIEVGAGELDMSGAAQSAKVQLGAGQANVNLADVQQADFKISAGQLTGTLNGKAPQQVTASVSAGSLDLEMPKGTYDLRQNVEAGDVSNLLATDMESPNKISVDVAAGRAAFYQQGYGPEAWDN